MKTVVLFLIPILLQQELFAEVKVTAIKKCSVKFQTTGSPSLVRIEGKSENDCTGKINSDGDKIIDSEFKLNLEKLDTGINLRNKHLRENYLHTDKFPVATVKLISAESFKELSGGTSKKSAKFEATLTLHGKDAPINDGTYEVSGNKATVKFAVDLPNHGVERPSFMGVKIVDKVNLTVEMEF